MQTPHEKHYQNILDKADRCVPLIEEWATNLLDLSCEGREVELANHGDALQHILTALSGTGEVAEMFWAQLADLHHDRYPDHPGRKEFDTSRSVILAKIEAKIWAAGRGVPADPFAGIAEGAR